MIRKPERSILSRSKQIVLCAAASILSISAASAVFAKDKAQEVLSKYEKTGETQTCLMLRSVRDTDALDDYTLLVEAGGSIYLNELNGRCIGLAREQRYTRQSPQARMCKGDIIQVVDFSGITLGSCSLGEFEKLTELPQSD